MHYKSILRNRGAGELASAIVIGDTSMELTNLNTELTEALTQVNEYAQQGLILTLTDSAEENYEIVIVTEWDAATNTATITRGQDNTTARDWSTAKVEIRVCVFLLDKFFESWGPDTIAMGANGAQTYTWDTGAGAIAIGSAAYAEQNSVALGKNAAAYDADSIAVGSGVLANRYVTAIGKDISSNWGDEKCVLIGYSVKSNTESYVINIGSNREGYASDNVILLGDTNVAYNAPYALAIGSYSKTGATSSDSAAFGVALGAYAKTNINNFSHFACLPGQPKSTALPNPLATHTNGDDIATRHRAAPQMTLASGIIDLTDVAATAQIELPTGTHFFPNGIDVIITGADTPGGSPEITVGISSGGTDILAATAITKDTAYQRQKIIPDSDDGVADIHIAVSTAGTGTTYNCRVIVSGYSVEDE